MATPEATELVETLWNKLDDLDSVILLLEDAKQYAKALADAKL